MKQYLELMDRVLSRGSPHLSRAGGTVRLIGESLSFSMNARVFPILTTRRVLYRGVLGELAAFLEGTMRVDRFEELGCNYWRPNAEAWRPGQGDVGRIYGPQWRSWANQFGDDIDQITELVEGIRNDPSSRRHVLTAWNPAELEDGCLPPCHILSQFVVDAGTLHCLVYMRSVDVCLGLPADMILYGALLAIIAQETGKSPGMLKFFFGDCHIYDNHAMHARMQLTRTPIPQPRYALDWRSRVNAFKPDDLTLQHYEAQEPIKYDLNV